MKFVAGLLVASTCCLKGHEPFETSSMVLAIRGRRKVLPNTSGGGRGKPPKRPESAMHQQNAGSLGPPPGSEPPGSGVPSTAAYVAAISTKRRLPTSMEDFSAYRSARVPVASSGFVT